jgi:hypothetical protein
MMQLRPDAYSAITGVSRRADLVAGTADCDWGGLAMTENLGSGLGDVGAGESHHRLLLIAVVLGLICMSLLFVFPAIASASTIEPVSVATGGARSNDHSSDAYISADGRYVVFSSSASNLVAGDTNAVNDVFLRDRVTGQTTRVSVSTNGAQGDGGSYRPSISADGRYVVFSSSASNLVPGDTNAAGDVFVRDRKKGTTTRVSVSTGGGQANGDSGGASMSADGRYVAFSSSASDLVSGDTNGFIDVFLHDRSTGSTTRVSVSTGGSQGNDDSSEASISANGLFVAFQSRAKNLVSGDPGNYYDVFVRDVVNGTTELVSVDSSGVQGNSSSFFPSLSADGRYVAFVSQADNLVSGDTNGYGDVFVFDRSLRVTTRVSVSSSGAEANEASSSDWAPSISADGRYVTFDSMASNLVAVGQDTNDVTDVFIHDTTSGQTALLSVDPNGVQGNALSGYPCISADGRYVAFSSLADNLIAGDTNESWDILVASASRYQQSDPRITYLDAWSYNSIGSASGGSFYSSGVTGAAAVVKFSGISIGLVATTGPLYGKALVSLDGGPAEYVDFYSAVTEYKKLVKEWTGLTSGSHTLTIKCAEGKINLDAVDITGTLAQAPAVARYQQGDTRISRVGPWSESATWSASGGSFATADSPGAAMKVAFKGSYLAWYATKGPGYGKAQVSLDGGTPFMVDLYGAGTLYKQRVYSTGLLVDGPHTLSIYWVGQKNPIAYGTRIGVDAFDVLGSLEPSGDPAPILWRYQQTDPRLTYLGNWSTGSTWSASGGSFYSTGVAGAAVMVKFTGTSIGLVARTAPWYGKARVALDGDWSTAKLVDFYSPTTMYKRTVEQWTSLPPGEHTLAIKCETASISLDALDINGYLQEAPKTTRIQENDKAWFDPKDPAYEGTWSTGTTWSASGGSFCSSGSSDSQVTITFTGTYLSWIAKTCSWYGIAKVTLVGGADGLGEDIVTGVDLYSAATVFKKPVYNTGLLPDTTHKVVIKWTGNKYWRSMGTSISVDAFDILLPNLVVDFGVDGKYYDGTPTLSGLTEWRLSNAVNGTTVFESGVAAGDEVYLGWTSLTFADPDVGTNKKVTMNGAYLYGADAYKYRICAVNTTTSTIAPQGLVVDFGVDGKAYDGTPDASLTEWWLKSPVDGHIVFQSGVEADDEVYLGWTSVTFADPNVGTNKTVTMNGAYLYGADAGNYQISAVNTTTGNIE